MFGFRLVGVDSENENTPLTMKIHDRNVLNKKRHDKYFTFNFPNHPTRGFRKFSVMETLAALLI